MHNPNLVQTPVAVLGKVSDARQREQKADFAKLLRRAEWLELARVGHQALHVGLLRVVRQQLEQRLFARRKVRGAQRVIGRVADEHKVAVNRSQRVEPARDRRPLAGEDFGAQKIKLARDWVLDRQARLQLERNQRVAVAALAQVAENEKLDLGVGQHASGGGFESGTPSVPAECCRCQFFF